MHSESNKAIIKKAQELLKDMGHQVKTTQLYELFSKLAGEANWNTAKARQTSFIKTIEKFTDNQENKSSLDDLYELQDLFNCGIDQSTNQPVILDYFQSPNSLFVGEMGSGKSQAMMSAALNFMNKNLNTSVFIIDPLKGAHCFLPLMTLPKVFPLINNEKEIHQMIGNLHAELYARIALLKKEDCATIQNYEVKTNIKLDRCLIVVEELNYVTQSILNFQAEHTVPNSSALKFKEIMRMGRSVGIWVLATSQKATASDIPFEIINNFGNKNVFRTSKAESSYLLGTMEAGKLTAKGMSYTEKGLVQHQLLSPDFINEAIQKLKKNTDLKMLLKT